MRFAKNSQDSFNKFEQSAKASFLNVGKSIAGLAGGFLAVNTAINQLTSSLRFADEINDIAKANEVAVSSVLKLSEALSLNGGEASNASKLLSSLTQSIDQAAQGSEETQKRFASLGISLNDLRKLDGEQILDKTLQNLIAINDPIKRNAAAMDLLGKSVKGVDIKGLGADFANNQKSFDEAENSFKNIGETFDKIDSASAGLKTSLATLFGPTILSAIQSFSEYIEAINFTMANGSGFEKFRMLALGNMSERLVDLQKRFPGRTNLQSQSGKIKFLSGSSQASGEDVREVIDAEAEKAKQEAERAAQKARDAAIEAKRKATEEAKNLDQQESAYRANLENDYQKQLRENFEKRKKDEADAEKEAYETKLKNLDLLQQQANRNFEEAQRQAEEAAEQTQRQFERVAGEISQAFTNGLFDSFRNGENFGKAMVRNIVALAQTWFARMFESLLTGGGFQKLLGSFGAMFSGGAIAGESGGGFSGIFSSIKDIFTSTNGSIVSSIQDLGVYLSSGNGGLGDVLGGFLGEYSSQIADGFGYFGAALQLAQGNVGGALGTAVGTFFGGPLGGAIGSFLGGALGGLFGGGLPPRVTESRSASSIGGVNSFFEGGDKGKRKLGAASSLDALNSTFINNLNTLFGAFDVQDDIGVNSLLTKKKNTRSRFNASINGQFLGFDDASFGKKGTIEEAFNSLVERALGSYTVRAIEASSLPEGIKKFFDGLTKKEDVAETINTLISMKNALEDLPPIFNAVRNAIDTTAYTTSLAQLKAQFEATQNFVNLFYTDAEKFDIFTGQLQSQLAKLNETLPTSRDAYRALVESINVTDEATRNQFNGLIALAPAMDQYFNQLQQQADGIREVNEALAEGLDRNLFSTFADYASARASVANGLSPNGFMAGANATQRDNALAEEVKVLKEQGANQQTILEAIAGYLYNMEKIYKQWNGDGWPAVRVI